LLWKIIDVKTFIRNEKMALIASFENKEGQNKPGYRLLKRKTTLYGGWLNEKLN
jgi:hypothetical protein